MSSTDETAVVRALLDAAGLPASDAELDTLVAAHAVQRRAVDGLYDVAAARYAVPALRFQADPTAASWHS